MKRGLVLVLALLLLWPSLALADTLSVKSKKANFRQGPSTRDPVAFSAERYYPVEVLQRKGGWIKVKDFEGDAAWVHESLVDKTDCVVVKVTRANIRQEPTTKSSVLFTASKGSAFKVLEKKGEWMLIQHADGDRGWIHQNLTWGQ